MFEKNTPLLFADEIAKRGVDIAYDNGRGKGAAIRQAIDTRDEDVLVFFDADGSHNVEDIQRLLTPITHDKADLVVASRLLAGSEEFFCDPISFVRFLGNKTSNLIVNLFVSRGRIKITDSQNGFRAIRTECARRLDLKENTFAIEQEMIMKAIKENFRIEEIPSFERKRMSGRSHLNPIKMLPHFIRSFLLNI